MKIFSLMLRALQKKNQGNAQIRETVETHSFQKMYQNLHQRCACKIYGAESAHTKSTY